MPKREPLTRNSKIILADLAKAKRPLSIKQISERNKIAWKTASDNSKILEKRNLIRCISNKGKGGKRGKRSCELTPTTKRQLGI